MPTVEIEGLDIHYVVTGAEEPAQRVLYVHGTACNGRVWERHMATLADRHQCAALDLPGHGESQGLGFRGAADHAHFVVALADHLGWDRFVLAGHSLGGAIALVVATYHPDRLSGLMLIDTGARLRVDSVVLEAARRAAAGESVAPGNPRWSYAKGTPDSVIDAVNADIGAVDPAVIYRDWQADDTFDFMSRIHQIDVPAIAICGEEDRLTPVRNHHYFHARMPRCALEIIEDCGHWPAYEQPERFDRAVADFVDAL